MIAGRVARNASRKSVKLTQQRLREVLTYDPSDGSWTRNVTRYQGFAGTNAARTGANGYAYCSIDGNKYTAHRLAFLFMTGAMPPPGYGVDHINLIKTDNRWTNLRLATVSQNNFNKPKLRTNKSGYKGVHWNTERQCWVASTSVNNRPQFLGYFHDPKIAHHVYVVAVSKLAREFARAA